MLDLAADALIYSTNVLLNCTGGVGSCLLERYGNQVQSDLHLLLKDRGLKYADQGMAFQHVTDGMPYKRLYHAVPCDGFYDTTEEIVATVLRKCLSGCVEAVDVKSVALSALATGYGHLGLDEFLRIASSVLAEPEFLALQTVTICLDDEVSYGLARDQIAEEMLALLVV
ncbi:MAG: macro domain-containing protein [Verrucomicrobiota bacterium]